MGKVIHVDFGKREKSTPVREGFIEKLERQLREGTYRPELAFSPSYLVMRDIARMEADA